jgi:hypothetical protein
MKEEPTILNAFDPIATVALATGHQPEREVRTVATKTKTNPIDDLPETNGTTLLAREVDESAGAFLARYERDYPSEYTDSRRRPTASRPRLRSQRASSRRFARAPSREELRRSRPPSPPAVPNRSSTG